VRKTDALHQLQEIDRQLDTTRANQARLTAQVGDRAALAARELEVKAVRDQIHKLETEQRDLELIAEQRRAKIAGDEKKLYGGKVTNPKELGSLQDEVAQDRRQLSTVEDKLLELMEQLEDANGRLATLESDLQRETADWQSLQERLKAQLQDMAAALTQLAGNRSQVATQITPADQTVYDTLRRQKGGTAVAVVNQRTCQACRVGLTPSQEQRARQGVEIITCHSCGRILYVPLS
jgi:uncharacterized protein